MRFLRRRDVIFALCAYFALGAWLFMRQDALIYLPDERPHGECALLPPTAEIVDNGDVRGYFLPAKTASEKKGALIIVYHGNAGNACDRMWYREALSKTGADIFLVEYPGYAQRDAGASGARILANVAAVAAYADRRWSKRRTIIIGESIGAGFAAYHATLTEVDTLILVTPFDRLSALVQGVVLIYPASVLLQTELDVATWAKSAGAVHIIAAESDEIIPRRRTDALALALPNLADYTIAPNTTHNTLFADPVFVEALVAAIK
jgi:pimeloyl-ACP methyl ester carboxylesterase